MRDAQGVCVSLFKTSFSGLHTTGLPSSGGWAFFCVRLSAPASFILMTRQYGTEHLFGRFDDDVAFVRIAFH
jgi:hypothetical protein